MSTRDQMARPDAPGDQPAVYHLARRLAGAPDADLDAIRAEWPDAPVDDPDSLQDWLAGRRDLAEEVCEVDPERPPDRPASMRMRTADEILSATWPEPVWAIPGLLPAGLTILAGRPKVGKSWLALQIAQAVAAGGVALDEKVDQGSVLCFALEDPPRRLQKRMARQGWPQGLGVNFVTMDDLASQAAHLLNDGTEELARLVEKQGYRLVTIDTLSRALRGNQDDVQAMTRALTPLQEVANRLNVAVLLIDHHRKPGVLDPDLINDILGSTAKGAVCDTAWGLYRERGKVGAKLAVVGRDVEERTLAMTWDGERGLWHAEGDADQIGLTERRQEILDALQEMGRSQAKDVANAVGQDRSNTHRRLQDLVAEGLVTRCKEGKAVYYDLPEPEEDTD